MSTDTANRTIALAGLYQSAELVIQIAWQGNADPDAFAASIQSLFALDPDTYAEVYGGLAGLNLGLQTLRATLRREQLPHAVERTRYVVNLLFLEKRLTRDSKHLQLLQRGIEETKHELEQLPATDINIIHRLADIYRDAISDLGPRIIVNGDQSILNNPDNASRIRASLLSGIRAAVLWRQAGGSRWRLMLSRSAIARELDGLMSAG